MEMNKSYLVGNGGLLVNDVELKQYQDKLKVCDIKEPTGEVMMMLERLEKSLSELAGLSVKLNDMLLFVSSTSEPVPTIERCECSAPLANRLAIFEGYVANTNALLSDMIGRLQI